MSWLKELNHFKDWAKRVIPKVKFDESKIPVKPDYNELDFWAAFPGKESKAFIRPEGINDEGDKKADVFYLHPTSYFGQDNWNYDFKNPQATELIEEVLMPLQASVFNHCCRIYAPKYRQATFYSFLWASEHGRNALQVAYADLKDAFLYYMQNENKGRPFFIASHSQGTCHALRLLEEVIDKSDYADRMVAAYTIGFRIPEEKFTLGHFEKIKLSQNATDFNSVIAWDSYLEKGKPSTLLDRCEVWYPKENKWKNRGFKKPVGINPISFENNYESKDASGNLGAIRLVQKNPTGVKQELFGLDDLIGLDTIAISTPMENEVGARLGKDGFLYITKPKHSHFKRMVLPGGNMHNYDYDFFYMNIRKNIRERLDAFLNRN